MTMVFNKPPNPLKGGTTDPAGTPPFRGQGGLVVLSTSYSEYILDDGHFLMSMMIL